jgi:beta-1,4-mannosyl-glycoprotein beta-1,4-N-acetylglucosaminyltransferase
MEILDPYVDFFVLSESPWSFTGNPKPLFYQENKELFKKFEHKIIHNIFTENRPEWNQWQRGLAQKGGVLGDVTKELEKNDLVLYSDCDEIPNLEGLNLDEISKDNKVYAFQQYFFYFFANALNVKDGYAIPWIGSHLSNWNILKRNSFDNFRNPSSAFNIHCKSDMQLVQQGGWHYSYLNGAESVKSKIQAYEHQEFNNSAVLDNIQNSIDTLHDPFGRNQFTIQQIEIGPKISPQYLVEHQSEYSQFIRK